MTRRFWCSSTNVTVGCHSYSAFVLVVCFGRYQPRPCQWSSQRLLVPLGIFGYYNPTPPPVRCSVSQWAAAVRRTALLLLRVAPAPVRPLGWFHGPTCNSNGISSRHDRFWFLLSLYDYRTSVTYGRAVLELAKRTLACFPPEIKVRLCSTTHFALFPW